MAKGTEKTKTKEEPNPKKIVETTDKVIAFFKKKNMTLTSRDIKEVLITEIPNTLSNEEKESVIARVLRLTRELKEEKRKAKMESRRLLGSLTKKTRNISLTGMESKALTVKMLGEFLLDNNKFLSTGKKGTLYHFNGEFWTPDGEDFVKLECQEILNPLNKWMVSLSREVIEYVSVARRGNVKIFNKKIYRAVFLNGTYDIEKEKWHRGQFFPEDYCTIQHPVTFDPKAKCQNGDRFFKQVMHPKDALGFYELAGLSLIKKMLFEINLVLYGKTRSGKSIILEVLTKLLGEDNVSIVHPYKMVDNRFATSDLHWMCANIAPELPSEKKMTSMAKETTGAGRIRAEQKGKDSFKFEPFASNFYTSNRLPEIDDPTDAWFYRWFIIEMMKSFKGKTIDGKLNKEFIQRDTLVDAMTTPEELSGFLNHLLKGCKRIMEQNGIPTSSVEVHDRAHRYKVRTNAIFYFVDECIYSSSDGEELKEETYAIYKTVCRARGESALSYNWFCSKFKGVLKDDSRFVLGETTTTTTVPRPGKIPYLRRVAKWTGFKFGQRLPDGTIIPKEQLF